VHNSTLWVIGVDIFRGTQQSAVGRGIAALDLLSDIPSRHREAVNALDTARIAATISVGTWRAACCRSRQPGRVRTQKRIA
jgi:hypothetical protein